MEFKKDDDDDDESSVKYIIQYSLVESEGTVKLVDHLFDLAEKSVKSFEVRKKCIKFLFYNHQINIINSYLKKNKL